MEQVNSKKTYSEIYEILNILGDKFISKVPRKLYALIDEERDKEYTPNLIGENGGLDESKIGQETIAMFALLNVKYFIQNEEEKSKLMKIYIKNEEKLQVELREKYNSDVFSEKAKIKQEKISAENENAMIEYKENIFMKVINKIKRFFFGQ